MNIYTLYYILFHLQRTSISASALLRVPSVVIKQEPLTDVEIQVNLYMIIALAEYIGKCN